MIVGSKLIQISEKHWRNTKRSLAKKSKDKNRNSCLRIKCEWMFTGRDIKRIKIWTLVKVNPSNINKLFKDSFTIKFLHSIGVY